MKKILFLSLLFLFSCRQSAQRETFAYIMIDSTTTEDYGTYLSVMRSLKEIGHLEIQRQQIENNYDRYKTEMMNSEYDHKWNLWNINQEARRKMYDAGTPVKDIDRIMDSISKNQ